MRKIKEVLLLKQEQKLTNRAIARSCSIGRATVSEYLRRAAAAGLSWPLPEGLDEAQLERRLFPPSPFCGGIHCHLVGKPWGQRLPCRGKSPDLGR